MRRDTIKEPYSRWTVIFFIVVGIISTIVIVGFSINGIVLNEYIDASLNSSICDTKVALD